jgi:hypothetical protein
MLVDQDYGDILSFLGEALECPFNLRVLCLGINDQKVALRIGGIGYVLRIDPNMLVFGDSG